jgi:hypothetical protein
MARVEECLAAFSGSCEPMCVRPQALLLQANASAALVRALADMLSTAVFLTYEQVRSVTSDRKHRGRTPQSSATMLDTAIVMRLVIADQAG